MRHLRTLLPLALVASLAAACGNGSSSSSSGDTTSVGSTGGFEIRTVYARYSPGVQFGPQVPQAVASQLKAQSCPMKPATLQGMLMECDAGKTVYLMNNPVVSGDVASASAKQVGHKKIWYVEVDLDSTGTAAMQQLQKSSVGTELAFVYGGTVLTSVVVDQSLHPGHVAIIGDYDQAQATKLAKRIAAA